MKSLSCQCLRVLDFDSAVTRQNRLLAKYSQNPYSVQIIDLLKYGPAVRAWINKRDASLLRKELKPSDRNKITLYGSGDFHHISALLIDQFSEDICVVIFDFHPDLDGTFPKFSCGSWVNLIAKKSNVKKIVMIGPSSEDLNFPHNLTFDFSHLKNKRVELYPFYHEPSITAFGRIVWENIRDKDMGKFMTDVADRLPSKKIYISIDKDCLKEDYALTNWERGVLSLDWLLAALKVLREKADIVGMDITGDYSPIVVNSAFKRLCAALDHPRQPAAKMKPEEVSRVNEETNLRILELFLK